MSCNCESPIRGGDLRALCHVRNSGRLNLKRGQTKANVSGNDLYKVNVENYRHDMCI